MLKTADIFQSGMVLQREKPVPVWGEAAPGETVTVTIQGQSAGCRADAKGNWRVLLHPLEASDAETLTVQGERETLAFTDVAAGEVWLAGGQSNMEFYLRWEKYWQEERGTVDQELRFYDAPEIAFDGQRELFDYSRMGIWRRAEGKSLQYFSAVGYYFARVLRRELGVPVGIVGCSWGGTRSASWMKRASVLPEWERQFQEETKALDWAEYWREVKSSPASGKGNPFENPLWNFIMERTPTPQELYGKCLELYGCVPEPELGVSPEPHTVPGCLFEHMVKPLAPFAARGVLWYQGESDDVDGLQPLYAEMLTRLIGDWRGAFRDAALPFLVVQLPGFARWTQLTDHDYPTIRTAQEVVTETVPQTYLCSISDLGEENDIHPKNKRDVGARLALLALAHVYGRELPADAPRLSAARREGEKLRLTFANAGTGLAVEGDALPALVLLDGEGRAVPYAFSVDGDSLLLRPERRAERVAFAQERWFCVNLYNEAHLPAVPFAAEL